VQPNAHRDLREIWLSPNRVAAEAAMATFAEKYAPKTKKPSIAYSRTATRC
jgi:hypothetical protein